MVPPTHHRMYAFESNQSFATLKQLFGDTDFKLFTKKQKTRKDPLILTPFLPKRFRQKNLLQ